MMDIKLYNHRNCNKHMILPLQFSDKEFEIKVGNAVQKSSHAFRKRRGQCILLLKSSYIHTMTGSDRCLPILYNCPATTIIHPLLPTPIKCVFAKVKLSFINKLFSRIATFHVVARVVCRRNRAWVFHAPIGGRAIVENW